MANLDLLVIESSQKKRKPSQDQNLTVNSIQIGGVVNISITKDGSGNFSFGTKRLADVASPTFDTDAATKAYVDAKDAKDSVRLASVVDVPLTGSTPLTIDGITVANTNRLLLKNQSAGAENGIYLASVSGPTYTLTRSFDANTDGKVTAGLHTFVEEGTANGDTGWLLSTNNPIVLGTTTLAFVRFTGSNLTAGDGIQILSNTISVKVSDLVGDGLADDGANNLQVVSADSSIKVGPSGVKVDYTEDFTNGQGSTILLGEVVFESASGTVTLVSGSSSLNFGSTIGIVGQASIANAAIGEITIKPGSIVGGYSGLLVNSPVYIHPTTPGAIIQSSATFVAGQHLVVLGMAISATQIMFDPKYKFEV